MSAKRWFRQLGGKIKRFGRQLDDKFDRFGHQSWDALKLLPQGFKDASKIYSSLEQKTHNIPVVKDIFGGAAKMTGGIGAGLSGNFNQARQDINSGLATGTKLYNMI